MDVAPEGTVVKADVEGGLAEGGQGIVHSRPFVRCVGALDNTALPGHDGVARSKMTPSRGHCNWHIYGLGLMRL